MASVGTIELTNNFKGSCILCNCTPVDEQSELRKPLPMLHAVGVDVNWGEDANICQICAGVMADLLGRPNEDKFKKLKAEHDELRAQHQDLLDRHEAQTERIGKILAGKKAAKEQKEAA